MGKMSASLETTPAAASARVNTVKKPWHVRARRVFIRDKYLLLMVLPAVALLILFRYIPIYGVIVAFQSYRVGDGFFGSKWVGFLHFARFFQDPYAFEIIKNTFLLGVYTVVFTFPIPILFAMCINEMKLMTYKRICQTISYMPYFISVVVVIGLVKEFTAYDHGKLNHLIALIGGVRILFLMQPFWFVFFYLFTSVWQGTGFGSIIYLAALAGINPELYESAHMDGANRLQKIIHIDIPGILPTVVVLFIFGIGGILQSDFQKILLLYNEATYSVADVLSTYVFRAGILGASYSYAAAVGVFTSVVSLLLLTAANYLCRKFTEYSLW